MSLKKLPSPQTVNRLYWIEEMPITAIARRYGCSFQSVHAYMKQHGIPTKGHRRQKRAACIECGLPVCMIRRWSASKRKYIWQTVIRCLVHHTKWLRRITREQKRKERGTRELIGEYDKPIRETAWVKEVRE